MSIEIWRKLKKTLLTMCASVSERELRDVEVIIGRKGNNRKEEEDQEKRWKEKE